MPVTTIGMLRPAIMTSARSVIRADGARGMNVSPRWASRIAAKTVSTAASSVRRKRVISAVVIVKGPPFVIWSMKSGTTEPREAMTLP